MALEGGKEQSHFVVLEGGKEQGGKTCVTCQLLVSQCPSSGVRRMNSYRSDSVFAMGTERQKDVGPSFVSISPLGKA